MTKEKIIESLLAYYDLLISYVKRVEYEEGLRVTKERKAQFGVCHVAYMCLDELIHDKEWVKRHVKEDYLYWADTPNESTNKKELIKALQVRINILKVEAFRKDGVAPVEGFWQRLIK